MKSIKEAEKSIHKFLPAIHEKYNSSEPIVSVIIDCYYKLDLVKQSIQSVLDQDYQNVEIVLVDNGAEENVSKYLYDIYTRHKNIALIKFKENQFSWKDTEVTVVICWNSAVLHCKGSIVTHLSYDDMFSHDCISRMARLFIENENCITAGPLPVSIDINGNINKEFSDRLKFGNRRPRYIDGKKLALDHIDGSPNKYLAAPGGVLFIKKDTLIQCGGFDRASDITQVIKFAIHGDSGFDPKAKLFWRHHDTQLNKLAKNRGVVWCSDLLKVVKTENIIEIWERLFTQDQVKLLHKFIKSSSRKDASNVAIEALRNKESIVFFTVIRNIANNCPYCLFYALWFSLLEVVQMLYEKASNIVKYK